MNTGNDGLEIVLFNQSDATTGTAQLSIILDVDAYQAMYTYAQTDLSRELGGILLGIPMEHQGGTLIEVKAAIEARYTDAARTSVKFTHRSWEYINGIKEQYFPELKIVGWFHTHPGFGIFLSEFDTFIHRNFFNLPWQVALVIDPVAPKDGFFYWQEDKIAPCAYALADKQFGNGGYRIEAGDGEYRIETGNGGDKIAVPLDQPLDQTPKLHGKLVPVIAGLALLGLVAGGSYYAGWTYGASQVVAAQSLGQDQGNIGNHQGMTGQPPDGSGTEAQQPAPPAEPAQLEVKIVYKHKVQPGESLWSISHIYFGDGSQYPRIAAYNRLATGELYPGQILLIPDVEE